LGSKKLGELKDSKRDPQGGEWQLESRWIAIRFGIRKKLRE